MPETTDPPSTRSLSPHERRWVARDFAGARRQLRSLAWFFVLLAVPLVVLFGFALVDDFQWLLLLFFPLTMGLYAVVPWLLFSLSGTDPGDPQVELVAGSYRTETRTHHTGEQRVTEILHFLDDKLLAMPNHWLPDLEGGRHYQGEAFVVERTGLAHALTGHGHVYYLVRLGPRSIEHEVQHGLLKVESPSVLNLTLAALALAIALLALDEGGWAASGDTSFAALRANLSGPAELASVHALDDRMPPIGRLVSLRAVTVPTGDDGLEVLVDPPAGLRGRFLEMRRPRDEAVATLAQALTPLGMGDVGNTEAVASALDGNPALAPVIEEVGGRARERAAFAEKLGGSQAAAMQTLQRRATVPRLDEASVPIERLANEEIALAGRQLYALLELDGSEAVLRRPTSWNSDVAFDAFLPLDEAMATMSEAVADRMLEEEHIEAVVVQTPANGSGWVLTEGEGADGSPRALLVALLAGGFVLGTGAHTVLLIVRNRRIVARIRESYS